MQGISIWWRWQVLAQHEKLSCSMQSDRHYHLIQPNNEPIWSNNILTFYSLSNTNVTRLTLSLLSTSCLQYRTQIHPLKLQPKESTHCSLEAEGNVIYTIQTENIEVWPCPWKISCLPNTEGCNGLALMSPGIIVLHPIKKIPDHQKHRQQVHRFRSKPQICKLIGIKLTGFVL